MKKKDIIYLSITLVLFLVAGYMLLGNRKKSSTGDMVEVVQPVDPNYDKTILSQIDPASNPDGVRDFTVKVNLKTELGNHNLFGR